MAATRVYSTAAYWVAGIFAIFRLDTDEFPEIDAPVVAVSVIYPGYIRSEINEKVKKVPFIVDTETGCRALAAAIEKEPAKAYVPGWPWVPLAYAMKVLPLSVIRKMA